MFCKLFCREVSSGRIKMSRDVLYSFIDCSLSLLLINLRVGSSLLPLKKNYHEIGLLKCLFKIPFSSNRFSYSAISLTSFRSYKYTRKKHPSKKNITNMSNVVPVILPPHTLLSLIQIHVIFSKLISTR